MLYRDTAQKRRKKAYSFGHFAEWAAMVYMVFKGYRLIARRYKTPKGEIDLIMQKGHCTVFVEVKARKTHEAALFSLQPAQQQRIIDAATIFVGRRPEMAGRDMRFDFIVVSMREGIHHILNAFTQENFYDDHSHYA